jgi:antitoxin component of MazEF toxin-antitoxin module
MGSKTPKASRHSEFEAIVRKRNQLTLPTKAAQMLNVREGDVLVLEVTDGVATIRPIRRSYAGIAGGVFGNADDYLASERDSWE